MTEITDLQVCHAYLECEQLSVTPYDLLRSTTGLPLRACMDACYRARRNGYLEYDKTLVRAWLTEKGSELLGIKHEKRELFERLPTERKPKQIRAMPSHIRFDQQNNNGSTDV